MKNKKKDKAIIMAAALIVVVLLTGILKIKKSQKLMAAENFKLEQERLAMEEVEKEKAEREKEEALKKIRENSRLEENKKKALQEQREKAMELDEEPTPVVEKIEEDGKKITVTKLPESKPSSKPKEMEQPSKREPVPVNPPAEEPNSVVEKPRTAKGTDKNKGTYPDEKPKEEVKEPKEEVKGKTGNPFLDKVAEPSTRGSRSEDLGGEGIPEAGKGDKF